ncbi:unnamed protein product [Ceratitis capitata]|uniref:(Mediterranean fruit fly) hypothetical protein n=1 Tax=Ceratitis capitata TaxID=7213 RepID=A0A811V4D0_CERCA|nr:unnamed protein product [Ceratitis capitata]
MKCEERKICVIYKVIQLKKEETPIESATAKADRKKGFKYRVFNMCLSLRNFCNTCRARCSSFCHVAKEFHAATGLSVSLPSTFAIAYLRLATV